MCQQTILKRVEEYHTLAHDLVDFAVLLSTDKFLMLVCKLNLDTYLVLSPLDERYLVDDHHGSFDSIVGTVYRESELVEANLSRRIEANV